MAVKVYQQRIVLPIRSSLFSDMILLCTDPSVSLTKPINSHYRGNSGWFFFVFFFFVWFNRMLLVLINLIFVTWTLSPIWQSLKTLQRLMTAHYINEAERMSSPLTEMHSHLGGGTRHPLKSVITRGNWALGNEEPPSHCGWNTGPTAMRLMLSAADHRVDLLFLSLLWDSVTARRHSTTET